MLLPPLPLRSLSEGLCLRLDTRALDLRIPAVHPTDYRCQLCLVLTLCPQSQGSLTSCPAPGTLVRFSCSRSRPGYLCPESHLPLSSETPEVCLRALPRTKMEKASGRSTWSLDRFLLTPAHCREPASPEQASGSPSRTGRAGHVQVLGLRLSGGSSSPDSSLHTCFVTSPAGSSFTLRTSEPPLPVCPSLCLTSQSLPGPSVPRSCTIQMRLDLPRPQVPFCFSPDAPLPSPSSCPI